MEASPADHIYITSNGIRYSTATTNEFHHHVNSKALTKAIPSSETANLLPQQPSFSASNVKHNRFDYTISPPTALALFVPYNPATIITSDTGPNAITGHGSVTLSNKSEGGLIKVLMFLSGYVFLGPGILIPDPPPVVPIVASIISEDGSFVPGGRYRTMQVALIGGGGAGGNVSAAGGTDFDAAGGGSSGVAIVGTVEIDPTRPISWELGQGGIASTSTPATASILKYYNRNGSLVTIVANGGSNSTNSDGASGVSYVGEPLPCGLNWYSTGGGGGGSSYIVHSGGSSVKGTGSIQVTNGSASPFFPSLGSGGAGGSLVSGLPPDLYDLVVMKFPQGLAPAQGGLSTPNSVGGGGGGAGLAPGGLGGTSLSSGLNGSYGSGGGGASLTFDLQSPQSGNGGSGAILFIIS
jgi:hypothetical protein